MPKRVIALAAGVLLGLGLAVVSSPSPAVADEPWVQYLETDGGGGSKVSASLAGAQWYTFFCRGTVNPRYLSCEREPCANPQSDGGLGQLIFLGSHHDSYLRAGYKYFAFVSEDGGGQSQCEIKQLVTPN